MKKSLNFPIERLYVLGFLLFGTNASLALADSVTIPMSKETYNSQVTSATQLCSEETLKANIDILDKHCNSVDSSKSFCRTFDADFLQSCLKSEEAAGVKNATVRSKGQSSPVRLTSCCTYIAREAERISNFPETTAPETAKAFTPSQEKVFAQLNAAPAAVKPKNRPTIPLASITPIPKRTTPPLVGMETYGASSSFLPVCGGVSKLPLQGGGLVSLFNEFDFPWKPYLNCIKNQGYRDTCSAFSTVAAMELVAAQNIKDPNGAGGFNNDPGAFMVFSEQALHYLGKVYGHGIQNATTQVWSADGTNNPFTYLNLFKATSPAMSKDWVAVGMDKDWPYNPSTCGENNPACTGSVNAAEQSANPNFYTSCVGYTGVCDPNSSQGIINVNPTGVTFTSPMLVHGPNANGFYVQPGDWHDLHAGGHTIKYQARQAAAFLTPYNGQVWSGPIIVDMWMSDGLAKNYSLHGGYLPSLPDTWGPDLKVAHSMLIVGFIPNDKLTVQEGPITNNIAPQWFYDNFISESDGGYFIVKNSWGTGYGDGGFVYLPLNYLERYGISFYQVNQVTRLPYIQ